MTSIKKANETVDDGLLATGRVGDDVKRKDFGI